MAVDKAIDSTDFDSKLTTVADAIRTAGGTTESMSFPSGMVEAISVLKSGSEAGGGRVARGTWVQASDGYYNTITHNLGKVPELAVIWETNGNSSEKVQCLIGVTLTSISFYMESTGTGSTGPYGRYYSSNVGITGKAASSRSVFGDANTTTIRFGNLNKKIIAGSSYEYIIM